MKQIVINHYKGKPKEFSMVDDEDFEQFNKVSWCINHLGYIGRRPKNKKMIYLHRAIMGNPKGKVVDHISGDKLDNRKCNLRICSIKENVRNSKISKNNTSGFTGVSWRKDRNCYQSYIMVNRKKINLGHFKEIKKAIEVRKEGEGKYFGEFRYSGKDS